MKTLLCSQKPPLPLHFTKPSPSLHTPTQTILLHPTTSTTTTTTTTWKVHASAKGFGGPASKENVSDVTIENKNSSNRRNGGEHLPQAVLNRIIVRILVSVGLPMATGIVLMNLLGLVKEQGLWDVPLWVQALTMFLTFGGSAVGMAYGPLSASWDAKRKGSLLGFEEVKLNWVEVWEEEEDDG